MTKVIVERERWYRGKGGEGSKLLIGHSGKMCCLGFAALACGYSENQIVGRATPGSIGWNLGHPLDNPESADSVGLMYFNDTYGMSDAERESAIHEAGLKVELDFEFVD